MAMLRSNRFTRTEKSWITYDWANSAYATIIMAAVFPIYFSGIMAQSGGGGDIWWGWATSLATLTLAVLAPILGAVGDFRGMKKKLFSAFLLLGLAFTTVMALTDNWRLMLVGYIFSYIGFAGSLLFYDSFLTDVTTAERMDRVSAWGYAMGYLGGSTIPFLISIAMIIFNKQIGISSTMAVKLSCLLCVFWWAVFSLPILRNVHQTHYEDKPTGAQIAVTFRNIRRTMIDIFQNKAIFVFMVAYFFYIDGVNTVIHMATAYGSSLGLGRTGMILALLVTQIVAVPFSIGFSKLSGKIGSIRMISIAIVIYFFICSVGFYMGFSLEPAQKAYSDNFNSVVRQSVAAADLGALDSAGRERFNTGLDELLLASDGILAAEDRAVLFSEKISIAISDAATDYPDAAARTAVQKALSDVGLKAASFLADSTLFADFAAALRRATLLFWGMAVLVGTCQGGIQALSRSFFGKLVPPSRSNEYFGFFDIFGKFAAVIGPALYALVSKLTGRSSIGILSLMLLFAIGLATILLGRKQLRQAEIQAADASLRSQESSGA
jgi:UMF1 family MFS transporter